jgi:hypothetical protein
VTREIDELIATSSAAPPPSAILAHAMVALDDGGFTLLLTIRDNDGLHQRKLEAPACGELAHATALIVALAIDPGLLATHAEPGGIAMGRPGEIAPLSTLPVSPPPPPVVMPAPSYPMQSSVVAANPEFNGPLTWRLGLVEFVGIGTLPGTHLGTGLAGSVQLKSWRLEATLSELSGNAQAKTPGKSAEFALYRLNTRGCWLVANTHWAIGPCAGVEIGLLRGEGHGVSLPQTHYAEWLGSTVGALFDWRLGSSSVLGVVADAEIPWVHPQFTLATEKDFWKPPWVAARIGITLSAGWR